MISWLIRLALVNVALVAVIGLFAWRAEALWHRGEELAASEWDRRVDVLTALAASVLLAAMALSFFVGVNRDDANLGQRGSLQSETSTDGRSPIRRPNSVIWEGSRPEELQVMDSAGRRHVARLAG